MSQIQSLLSILAMLLLCQPSSAASSSKGSPRGIEVREFLPDTTTVIHNPCTGWSIYTDGYIPRDVAKYYADMEACGALKYATILYIRLPWALLEPEEGKYAWKYDKNFMQLVCEAKRRNIKLAFRVYYDNKDYRIPISPRYLIQAGAKGYMSNTNIWTPYADDPVFLAKLDKFLEAMGREFNNPDITDYVDGFGLGIWGEGFGATYANPQNKDAVLYHVARTYARNFSKVIVAINAHSDIGNVQLSELADCDDIVFRHDAIGSKVWFEPTQSQLMMSYFPSHFTIAESMWWLSQGPKTSLYTNEGFKDWREVMEFTYSEAKRIRSNLLDLRNVGEASTLWMSQAKDLVDLFNQQAGYRLTPVKVTYPGKIKSGETFTIRHTWKNSGWGVCPNNNSHWGYKYKTAFALLPLDSDEPVEIIIDEQAEPSKWLREQAKTYTFGARFQSGKGKYRLAVGLVDVTKNRQIGLRLAVSGEPLLSNGWLQLGNVNVR